MWEVYFLEFGFKNYWSAATVSSPVSIRRVFFQLELSLARLALVLTTNEQGAHVESNLPNSKVVFFLNLAIFVGVSETAAPSTPRRFYRIVRVIRSRQKWAAWLNNASSVFLLLSVGQPKCRRRGAAQYGLSGAAMDACLRHVVNTQNKQPKAAY